MKLKFIYWFTFYDTNSPTVRYRGQYPLEYFKNKYNIDSYFVYPSYKPLNFFLFVRAYFSALLSLRKDSLIMIQSVHSNFIYANALKLLVKFKKQNTYYDLDDADYLRFPTISIYYFIKNCSAVTVGSAELLKNISKLNSSTILIPCPTPDLKIVKQKRNEVLTIGWIGDFSKGHKESLLNFFFPALMNLSFQIRLVLLGVVLQTEHEFLIDYFKNHKNILLEMPQNINWKNEVEIQNRIADFDIGIATLLDTEFYRSKSAFKAKQCLNNGVPVLSSDVAENNLFVDHGKNGFLCSNPTEFRQRIIEIKEMSDEHYQLLSIQARKTVAKFDLAKFCNGISSAYQQLN